MTMLSSLPQVPATSMMGFHGNAKKHSPAIYFGGSSKKQPTAQQDSFEPMDVDIPEAESSNRNQGPVEGQNPQSEPPKKQLPLQSLFRQVDSHLRTGTPLTSPLLGTLSKRLTQRKDNLDKLFRHLHDSRNAREFDTAIEILRRQFPDEPEPVDSPKFLFNIRRLPYDIKYLIFKYAFESEITSKLIKLSGRSAKGKERHVSRDFLLNLSAIGFKNKINTTHSGNSVLDEALSMRKKGIFKTFLEPPNTSKVFREKQANSCSKLGFPLLNIAILTNQPDEVDLLINNGADPLKNDTLGKNALDYAALMGKQELLNNLIEKVQDRNTKQKQKISDSYQNSPDLLNNLLKKVQNPLTPQKIRALKHQCATQQNLIAGLNISRNETKYLAMKNAIIAGSSERVLALLAQGVEPGSTPFSKRYKDNVTPIHIAASYGEADILKLLFEAGGACDIETTPDNGNYTPFLKAARENHQDVVRILSELGVNLHHKTNTGFNAADLAQNQGHAGMLRLLHQLAPSLFQPEDQGDWTLAHFAAKKGQSDILRVLFEVEPALLYESDSDGDTPAHVAATNGKADSLRTIHALAPALLRERNSEGLTPADLAIAEGHPQIIQVLHELDPHLLQTVDANGNTYARSAISHEKLDSLRTLHHIQPLMFKELDSEGNTLAQYAAANGDLAALKTIHHLEPGLIHLRGTLGSTPAHRAAEKGQLEVLKWLNEVAPALLRKPNALGVTPFDLAESREQAEVIRYLQGIGIHSTPLTSVWRPDGLDVFMGSMDYS